MLLALASAVLLGSEALCLKNAAINNKPYNIVKFCAFDLGK
jgi:hypothetical protein